MPVVSVLVGLRLRESPDHRHTTDPATDPCTTPGHAAGEAASYSSDIAHSSRQRLTPRLDRGGPVLDAMVEDLQMSAVGRRSRIGTRWPVPDPYLRASGLVEAEGMMTKLTFLAMGDEQRSDRPRGGRTTASPASTGSARRAARALLDCRFTGPFQKSASTRPAHALLSSRSNPRPACRCCRSSISKRQRCSASAAVAVAVRRAQARAGRIDPRKRPDIGTASGTLPSSPAPAADVRRRRVP